MTVRPWNPQQRAKDYRFWTHDDPHCAVFDLLTRIRRNTRNRRRKLLDYACLYDDTGFLNLASNSTAPLEMVGSPLSFNVIRRNVDTLAARIVKNRPSPMAVTTDGTFSEQRRAKKLTQFGDGMFDEAGYWRARQLRVRDALIFGSGYAYNFRVGKRIRHERVFPWEIDVDPREAMLGAPRTFFLTRYVDRLDLLERYPGCSDIIEQAAPTLPDDELDFLRDDTSDLVPVAYVWRCASDEDGKNGHFAACVTTGSLVEPTPYKRTYPPLSKLDYRPALAGYHGDGMASELVGLQMELNGISSKYQEMNYMMGGGHVLVEDGSAVTSEQLDNGVGSVIRYRGTPPQWVTPQAAHPDLFNYLMQLRGNLAFEETGVSQMAASSQVPAGIESGKAMRTYSDIGAERFLPFGRQDEEDAQNTFWQFFDLAEEIHEEFGLYSVKAENDSGSYRASGMDLEWAKVRIDRNKLILRTFPTSYLAQTPAARWEQIQDFANSGMFEQDELRELMDFPDLQRVQNLQGAARKIVESILEKILDAEGDELEEAYVYPEPVMNLDLCVRLGIQTYLEAKVKGANPANLSKVMQFVNDARAEVKKATPKPDAPAPDNAPPMDPNLPPPGVEPMPTPMPGEEPMPMPMPQPEAA